MIKYKGVNETEYIINNWTESDIIGIMRNNNLETKKEIIQYLMDVQIHVDSIPMFLRLLKEVKKNMKTKNQKENKRKIKIKSIVDKEWKK